MSERWEIDWEAFHAARYSLGIVWPVTIRLVPNLRFMGFHQIVVQPVVPLAAERPTHLIQLRPFMSVPQASKTLWHELSHALDAERDAAKDGLLTRQINTLLECNLIDYNSRPGERRAKRLERRALTHPLVVGAE